MDQIRELLIGPHVRETEERISALEARLREVEVSLSRQIDALSARLEALAGESKAERLNSLEELSRGIATLGEHVRKISRS